MKHDIKFFQKYFTIQYKRNKILQEILCTLCVLTFFSSTLKAECMCADTMGEKIPSFSEMLLNDLPSPKEVKVTTA